MSSSQLPQSDKELSWRLWSTIGGLVAVAAIVGWAFWTPRTSEAAEHQKMRAESLAYQAFEIRRQNSKSNRGPASVTSLAGEGQVGLAADGKPYSYRVLEEGTNWVVKVWSESSPDQQTEVRIRKDQL